ncbi:MAG: cytochrome c oxidase assembly factor 1 family protein [Verrucomicrobiaceae bacterium]|nr:cytochrome c oxidase assembly factor 1 family protein [Verrucomicrobiaceae bacterium]
MNQPPPVPFGDPSKVQQDNQAAVKKGILFGCGGCGLVIMIGVLFVAAIVFVAITFMSRSDVCAQAVAKAQASARVQEALGQPITQGWWVTGSINTSNSTGEANINFSINGPKGTAQVHAEATKVNGVWNFSVLTVTLPDGKVVDLVNHGTAMRLEARQQLLMHAIETAIAEHDDHIAAASA